MYQPTRPPLRTLLFALLAMAACLAPVRAQNPPPADAGGDQAALVRLADGGHVLMIRHALAPGTGDPPGFRLDDCSTQRNLDATGRSQARAIGAWLKARGITSARVYSSQWCRCLETARLLDLGAVTELPALNSFYQRADTREANLQALRQFLASRPAAAGEPVILVTHQVTISAITGSWTGSGEGVVIELDAAGLYPVRARLGFED